jgi:hypothetical protein
LAATLDRDSASPYLFAVLLAQDCRPVPVTIGDLGYMRFMHSYKSVRTLAFAGMALAVAPGCGDNTGNPAVDAAPPAPDAAPPPDAPDNGEVTIERSILINDAETLGAGDFSLRRTVQAIIDSSEGEESTPEDFIASLLATFNDASRANPDNNLTIPVDVRSGEAGLSPSDLLDPANAKGLRVVGIFNRFERIPMMGEFCGSARLVYVMPTDAANNGSTLTLMFDAAVPNPDMAQGREGCRVVAEFWAGLSDIDDPADRAEALETFFYVGTADLPAVVSFNNFQASGGITTDHFINGVKWQMRTFNTGLDAAMVPVARPVRSNTPVTEFFDSDFDPATAGAAWADTDPAVFAAQRTAFQQDFTAMQLTRLSMPEASGNALTAQSIVLGFGVVFGNPYRDFQSDSDDTDNGAVHADDTFRNAITTGLASTDLTADIVLNRANALTCGGCHFSAVGDPVGEDGNGDPVMWPDTAPGGFVHINEDREISELLETYWLPDRLAKLNTYLGASTASNAATGRSCALDEVKATKAALLASRPGSERQAALAAYDRAVDLARACDAAQPGALTLFRDPH